MTALRDAIAFLTRVPIASPAPLTSARLSRAAALFPLVGLLVGGVLGGVRIAADTVLSPGPATLLALAAAIALTGALHEDGLADTADGLGAHVGRERRLEILRDSRIGTYGGLALILSTLLAWSLLAGLDGVDCLRAALAAHVLARWSMVLQARVLRPARRDGAGALLAVTPSALAVATVVAIAASLGAAGLVAGAGALATAVLTTLVACAVFRRALGGATGDTYGAAGKLVELTVFAVLAALWT